MGKIGRLVHNQIPDTLDSCAPEEVRSFRVQENRCSAVEEYISRPGNFFFLCILIYLHKTDHFGLEMIAYPYVIKVAGHVQHAMRESGLAELGHNMLDEILEAIVECCFHIGATDSLENLLNGREHIAYVPLLDQISDPHLSLVVIAFTVEHRSKFWELMG